MRLINADALIDSLNESRANAKRWADGAEGEEKARAEGCHSALMEAIMRVKAQPTASPWHRVEEPPKDDNNEKKANMPM